MTDLLIQPVNSRGDTFPRSLLDGCRTSVVTRYSRPGDTVGTELRHSKSDDLVLQSASVLPPEVQNARCDSPIPKASCLVYEDDVVSPRVLPKAKYFSDGETDEVRSVDKSTRKVSGDFSGELQRLSSRYMGLYDRVDPEDSIRDMITENDFYRFVLFKRHYEKYLHLSQKYEEARNIAYYLEEKYHEVKAERDGLSQARQELERKLETRELELHEKEEELFLQLEKVVRLEEDCEKLRAEKEKFGQWKDKLEREKNEAYRQLKRQAAESEATRRGLERARQEVVRQVTAIAAEKESLEKENEKLKETLNEERRGVGHYMVDLSHQKKRINQNVVGLEKEVSELKFIARQSASLNNQFKKGMKHLAACKRKKCSVCAYTKAAFGEYAADQRATATASTSSSAPPATSVEKRQHMLSCFQAPLQDLRNWIRPVPPQGTSSSLTDAADLEASGCSGRVGRARRLSGYSFLGHSSPLPSTRSEYSFRRAYSETETQTSASESPSPSPSLPLDLMPHGLPILPYISYIDEVSTSSSSESSSEDSGHGEESSSFNMLDEAIGGGPPCHCSFGMPGGSSTPQPPAVNDTSLTSSATPNARAFSSDSGFSSELYDTHRGRGGSKPGGGSSAGGGGSSSGGGTSEDGSKPSPGLQRSKWTASFRKLISRVSKRTGCSTCSVDENRQTDQGCVGNNTQKY